MAALKPAPVRVALSGTGFVARNLFPVLQTIPSLKVTSVLTRRDKSASASYFPEDLLTNSIDEAVEAADIVVECSGDAVHAAGVMLAACNAGRRIVTMNSEAQVTVVSALVRDGHWISEAPGDQPGCLAELDREARGLGFEPLAYVNLKGFLNPDPLRSEMQHWADRQRLSLRAVTSFTDGTKLQIEQVLVANGLHARIVQRGMIGGRREQLADLDHLVAVARAVGEPISDYVVQPGGFPGVCIVADNPLADLAEGYLPFSRLKTRDGSAYVYLRPHHLVHLELAKALKTAASDPPLLNNGPAPVATAAAVAKRALPSGHLVEIGIGGFDLRGEAIEIAECPDALPITLADGIRLKHAIEPGQILTFSDVEMPESLALDLYRSVIEPRPAQIAYA